MPTILNVDDQEVNRYIRSEILRKGKYRVVEADGGRRALELCRSLKPELVLLDVNMPDLGGREVCRRIKEECRDSKAGIVVHISATATATEDQVCGLEGGADAYLAEPVDAELLLATVRSMLRLHSAERKLAERDAGLRRLVDSNVVGIAIAGMQGVNEANDEYLRIVGMTRDDLVSGRIHWRKVTSPEHLERFLRGIEELRRRGAWTPFETDRIRADGSRVPVLIGATALSIQPLKWICFVADLSAQKRSEAELRARTGELTQSKLIDLEGLICVCAWCKRIHDGGASWQPMEVYIEAHSKTKFTHGICQDCLGKLDPVIHESVQVALAVKKLLEP